jgi:hypothetical protein
MDKVKSMWISGKENFGTLEEYRKGTTTDSAWNGNVSTFGSLCCSSRNSYTYGFQLLAKRVSSQKESFYTKIKLIRKDTATTTTTTTTTTLLLLLLLLLSLTLIITITTNTNITITTTNTNTYYYY